MIDFTALTVVDYAVVFVLIVSAIFSTLRGMTREFLGLLGWVVAVVVANYARPLLEDPIADMINADGLSAALAWGTSLCGDSDHLVFTGQLVVSRADPRRARQS